MVLLYGLFSLTMPLLALAVAVLCVWIIWRTLTLPRGGVRHAACERCRYEVGEITSFTCPECGEDLRQGGIITPRMETARRGSLAGAIIAWTVLCVLGMSVASTVLFMYSAVAMGAATVNTTTTWSLTLSPNSGAYRDIQVTYDSDWQAVTSVMEIDLHLTDGSRRVLTLDPGPMRVIGLSGGEAAWDADTIATWLAESGLDATDQQVALEAQEAGRCVDLLVMSPSSGYSMTCNQFTANFLPTGGIAAPASMSMDRELVVLMIGGTVLLGVYLVGIVLMCFRRARLRRAVPPANAHALFGDRDTRD